MVCDIEALRIRLKKIYEEEKNNRPSIVFLEDPPVLGNKQAVRKIKKTVVIEKKKQTPKRDDSKVKKAINFIEINYISKCLEDMKPFERAVQTQNKRELSKLSVTLKVDLGKLYGIPGAYHRTEDQEIDKIIKQINKLRFE